jgi:hypothetical protein
MKYGDVIRIRYDENAIATFRWLKGNRVEIGIFHFGQSVEIWRFSRRQSEYNIPAMIEQFSANGDSGGVGRVKVYDRGRGVNEVPSHLHIDCLWGKKDKIGDRA